MDAPTREFLAWVARAERSYADAMDAWGSHCPRYTVWEDALAAGLVQVECGGVSSIAAAVVRLTRDGQLALGD